ncbi:hypothetical protein CHS0354_040985, partial [Potamilus streckersoni]
AVHPEPTCSEPHSPALDCDRHDSKDVTGTVSEPVTIPQEAVAAVLIVRLISLDTVLCAQADTRTP